MFAYQVWANNSSPFLNLNKFASLDNLLKFWVVGVWFSQSGLPRGVTGVLCSIPVTTGA